MQPRRGPSSSHALFRLRGAEASREFLGAIAYGLLTSCVDMPDPPPPAQDLSALAAQYDRPTAELPIEQLQRVLDEGRRRIELGETLNRLRFVRDAIDDTSTGLVRNTNSIDLVLQGSIAATVACPGHGAVPTTDGAANGVLRLRFGVENSHLRRGFEGAAESCRILVSSPPTPGQRVVVNAAVTGDLGRDLDIGNTSPLGILMRIKNVSGQVEGATGTIDLSQYDYHFRLTATNGLEVLLDSASFGLPDWGSVVFAVRSDGSFVLRERRGEWVCGAGGEACVLR